MTALGYHALYSAEDGVKDICEALISGKIDKTTRRSRSIGIAN